VSAPRRWEWDADNGPARLVAELAEAGISWIRAPALVEAAERDPWGAAGQILGERAELVERQPIRPVPGGRTFSSGAMAAPFHSDSQTFLGVPPHVQVMACRQAAVGGENLYLDTWPLIATIEREAPELFARLFDAPRRFPFVFGDLFGPTVSLRGGSLVFTHTAFPEQEDGVASALRPFLESAAIIEVHAEAGDVLVAHNHRLLHGRRGFDGTDRSFTRLLVWRRDPFPIPETWRELARRAAAGLRARLSESSSAVRERFGLADEPDPEARRRLRAVFELMRGVPAGVLSAREGVPEPELYRWRAAALSAALAALAGKFDDADDRALRASVADLVARGGGPG
jgi:gamma-butyrobetaine dioxygenase